MAGFAAGCVTAGAWVGATVVDGDWNSGVLVDVPVVGLVIASGCVTAGDWNSVV